MSFRDNLNLPDTEKCFLYQAVLWIACGIRPVPEELFRATHPSQFPSSGIATASEKLPGDQTTEKTKEKLIYALRSGKLESEGIFHEYDPKHGAAAQENPREIPLEYWQSDRVDWEESKLTLSPSPTQFLTIRHIKVPTKPLFEMFPREVVGTLKGETIVVAMGETAGEPEPERDVDPSRTGFPGRPTSRHLIEAELRRRADEGEMLPVLEQEAHELREWFVGEKEGGKYPDAPIPKEKTIKNRFRDLHRMLKKKA